MNLRLGAPEWVFLAVLFGGMGVLFFGAGVWAWYGPRRPGVKFRRLHGRLCACRDADRSLLLPTMTPFLSAARAPLQAARANELYDRVLANPPILGLFGRCNSAEAAIRRRLHPSKGPVCLVWG